jgi:hypothetical protein
MKKEVSNIFSDWKKQSAKFAHLKEKEVSKSRMGSGISFPEWCRMCRRAFASWPIVFLIMVNAGAIVFIQISYSAKRSHLAVCPSGRSPSL